MATRATGGLVLEQVRVSGLVWGPQLQRRVDADPAAVANVCLAFRYESKHIGGNVGSGWTTGCAGSVW